MGKFIDKKTIDNSTLLSWGFRAYLKFIYFLRSDRSVMEKTFRKRFKKKIDWKNPISLQEKIQWLKLYHRTDIQTQCADKIAVRDYVAKKIGAQYLIPQLQILNNAKELTPVDLPEVPFIIKCNHNSGGYTIVKDKNKINWKKERIKFGNLLKQNYYYQSREWQYKNIIPKIIIEELLLDEENNIPLDYKFFCFNGHTKMVQVRTVIDDKVYITFFDLNWKKVEVKYVILPKDAPIEILKPEKLDEMIKLANRLSSNFPFTRIDFYHNKNTIYFGEITFHPGSGMESYTPEYYNNDLGNLIDLKKIK